MKIKYLLVFSVVLFGFYSVNTFAQEDIQFGKKLGQIQQQYRGALYDYSDPAGINMKVLVYGYVEFPGEYVVPASTSVNELLGLAGGPTQNADIEDLRIFRINQDSTQSLIRFNYNDLLWNDEGLTKPLKIPNIKAGDILLVPGSPRYFFKDYLQIGLSVLSAAISLAILIFKTK
jgi:protein involved in polysaccharide export with SLBB domain